MKYKIGDHIMANSEYSRDKKFGRGIIIGYVNGTKEYPNEPGYVVRWNIGGEVEHNQFALDNSCELDIKKTRNVRIGEILQ